MSRFVTYRLILLGGALATLAAPQAALGQARGDDQIVLGLGVSFPGASGQGVEGLGASVVYDRMVAGGRWAGVRGYAGGFFTRTQQSTCPAAAPSCAMSSQVAVAGAKVRFLAPVPYVGPYLEIGAGVSAGSINTRYAAVDQSRNGLTFHVPFGIGLAFGRQHQHKVAFDYFAHLNRTRFLGQVGGLIRPPCG